MIEAEVIFDGNLIYCNGLVIERGSFDYYFVSNSDEEVVKDYVTIEDAVKYCKEKLCSLQMKHTNCFDYMRSYTT